MKLIFKMQHAAALKDKHGRSSLRYYSNYQPDYLYVTIQKEWCEEITDIEFAGETLMASKYAHEVLTWVYGDYMKLPPEAERVPAHSTIDIQVFDEEA
jgi:lipopolysaccharide cholinephosphotransferase